LLWTRQRWGLGHTPAVKVIIIVILPILLYAYQLYNIGLKEAELASEQARSAQIQEEIKNFGATKAVVEGLIEERKKLNEQLEVIETISKKRAYKLQAIATLQKNLIDDLWLTELEVGKGEIVFKGLSRTPTSIQEIVENLNKLDLIETALNREQQRVTVDNKKFNSFEIVAKVKQ
jgi:Tfp pilus assembly protein PilN